MKLFAPSFLRKYSGPGLLLISVLAAYYPLQFNDFVSWDDQVYIINNPLIQVFNSFTFKQLFFQSFEGHYHPLTLISLSLDYHLFGLNPIAFHLHNLLLHVLNTLLVWVIFKKVSHNSYIAWITAMMFGLHPMHVEAVAWATARKDVLYSFYFLLSVLCYQLSEEKNKKIWYYLSLTAFIFSLFSKGQAVFLPLCLIIIGYLKGKELFSRDNWRDKIPYLILALFMGIIAFIAQKSTGYMGENAVLPVWWKMILTAALSLWSYVFQLIWPVSLSAYYPVPEITTGGWLFYAIICLILSVALGWFVVKYLNKKKIILAGILFFLANIFIFLRWIPISNYIIADRYTYLSSIGLFFLAAHGINWFKDRFSPEWLRFVLPLCLALIYGSMTWARVGIWKDSITLVNDILEKHPDVYPALNTRGIEKMSKGDYKGALADFNHAISIQPGHSRGWANRASLLFRTGEQESALKDMNEAVFKDASNSRLLNNRGLMLDALGWTEEALKDFNTAIKIDPYFAEAYTNRGMELARQGKPEDALHDFNQALDLNPDLATAYANRGKIRNQTADFTGAVIDLETALSKGLKNPVVFFDLGFSWYNLKDFYKARQYFDKALELKPDFVNALKYRGYTQFNDGDFLSAINDFNQAVRFDTTDALVYGMRGLAFIRVNRNDDACKDFARAESMGLVQVKKEREKYCP